MYKLTYTLLLSIILLSCSRQTEPETATAVTLKMDSLASFNPFSVKPNSARPLAIVSYLNVSCPPCLDEIKQWQAFDTKHNDGQFEIKLVCYAEDDFEFFKYLCREKQLTKFPYAFVLDTTQNFAVRNPLMKDKASEKTVIVDAKGKVLASGSPLHNESILEVYKKIINSARL